MKRLQNESGFLLAENIIAILIISVALVSYMALIVKSQQAVKTSGGYTAAVFLAQRQAEILKGTMDAAEWASRYASLPQNNNETFLLNGMQYTVATQMAACPETEASRTVVEVVIVISWQENGRKHTYQLLTAYPAVVINKLSTGTGGKI